MFFHHRITFLTTADTTGDDHLPVLHPDAGIGTWDKVRGAPPAEAGSKLLWDPDPLTHGDPSGKGNTPVAQLRICRVELGRPFKEKSDPFVCDLLRVLVLGSPPHGCISTLSTLCGVIIIAVHWVWFDS